MVQCATLNALKSVSDTCIAAKSMSSSAFSSLGLGVLKGDVYKAGDLAVAVPRNFNAQRKQKA